MAAAGKEKVGWGFRRVDTLCSACCSDLSLHRCTGREGERELSEGDSDSLRGGPCACRALERVEG